MTKSIFKDKYPINSLELSKKDISLSNVDEIIKDLKEKIDSHPIATYISIFDNFKHTTSINGEIADGIIDAKVLIFCFGKAIPTSKILAVRPRTFGVTEIENSFLIDFMDAPNDELTEIMINWTTSIK